MRSFDINVGDTVKVISECQSKNKIGIVENVYKRFNNYIYAEVNFPDRINCIKFNILSLKKISPYSEEAIEANNKIMNEITNKNNKENKNMALNGNYVVAVVKFVDGYNTNKSYNFAYYDNNEDNICIGDYALVNSKISGTKYSVVEVINIAKKEDVPPVADEIICKVDFTNYNKRKAQRAEKEKIRKQMDMMVKENQELVLYQMLAEKSPEMAELLAKYKDIGNV